MGHMAGRNVRPRQTQRTCSRIKRIFTETALLITSDACVCGCCMAIMRTIKPCSHPTTWIAFGLPQ